MRRSPIAWARDWASLTWQRFRELLADARQDHLIWTWLLVLLGIDLIFSLWFAGARLLYILDINRSLYEIRFLRIDADQGLPEWYSYAKIVGIILLLGRMALTTRQLVYPVLVFLFVVVLVDDAVRIHEGLGKALVGILDLKPMLGVRARDVGEVITWAVMGAITMPIVFAGFAFSKRTHVANGLAMLLPFIALLFFAIGVDQAHQSWRNLFFGAEVVLATLEDGGEMMAISVEFALAAVLVRR
jgi:hypothetical protein